MASRRAAPWTSCGAPNGEKLSTREITLRVVRDRGLDTSRSKLVLAVIRRMNNALRRQRKLGVVESERFHGAWAVWRLADCAKNRLREPN